ncbi:hypothetical protein [Longimicrobium sp.]|uniref:hypothetical protein n=1 Tax=Longimicrobium sp. TaxID=2029185 RepID=UPI002EDA5EA0
MKNYVRDCERLGRAVNHALEDLEFMHVQKKKIRYAVDFSEIYAYAQPAKTAREFLFLDDSEETAEYAQRIALDRLFFTGTEKPVLLAPYALELQTFVVEQQREALNSSLRIFPSFSTYVTGQEFQAAAALAERIAQEHRAPTVDEERMFTTFLETHGSWLRASLLDTEPQPIRRIRSLFQASRLDNLEALLNEPPNLDSRIVDRWFAALRGASGGKRSISGCRIDALAMATLESSHRKLEREGVRLLLVTRSDTMHNLFEAEHDSGLWNRGLLLRHPRVLSVLASVEGRDYGDAREQLQSTLRTLSDFSTLIRHGLAKSGFGLGRDVYDSYIAKLRKHWAASEQLAVAASGEPGGRHRTGEIDVIPRSVKEIIALLRDSEQLKQAIYSRIQAIADIVDHEHRILGGLARVLNENNRDRLNDVLHAERNGGMSLLRTKLRRFPYTLHLYSDTGATFAEMLCLDPVSLLSWREMVDFFWRTGESEMLADRYEGLLIMACVIATVNEWDLAEQYCKGAIETARDLTPVRVDAGDVSPHEAIFLLAVCHRKFMATVERLHVGIDLLQTASQQKREWNILRGELDRDDPRYLNERAVQILLLNTHFRSSDPLVPELSSDYALMLLDKADEVVGDDLLLKAQIANNRLYYQVVTAGDKDFSALRNQLDGLKALQSTLEPNQDRWPAFIQHTVAYADWALNYPHSSQRREQIITCLANLVEGMSQEGDRELRKAYEAQLKAVQANQPFK